MAPKVLFVLTSHDQFADGSPTGWWLVRLSLSLSQCSQSPESPQIHLQNHTN
jgi:hypothetical protein